MKKQDRKKADLLNAVRRERKKNYAILYTVTLLIWVLLMTFSFYKGYFTGKEFVVNMVNNIIGILPPILIFDFFNEKLSREASVVEVSNQITEALMSNPETMELFTETQKKEFIHSAVASIVRDDDAIDMINSNLQRFLFADTNYRIRTEFKYTFELRESLPRVYNTVVQNLADYYYVQEQLHYKIKFLSDKVNNLKNEVVKIGFVFDNHGLDNMLREKSSDEIMSNCIFRETLDVRVEDIPRIKAAAMDKAQFQQLLKLDLQIDQSKGVLEDVAVCESGIVCYFRAADFDRALSEHTVRIIFHMPKQWGSVLEIALMDPVRAPHISVSYPEDAMQVEMYSFLSEAKESSLDVAHEHLNGVYDVMLGSEWVYPISGVIFSVQHKNENE